MDIKTRLDTQTDRVSTLWLGSNTFEEQKILASLLQVFYEGGVIETLTAQSGIKNSFSFSHPDPPDIDEQVSEVCEEDSTIIFKSYDPEITADYEDDDEDDDEGEEWKFGAGL
jgi:hypothetical protein